MDKVFVIFQVRFPEGYHEDGVEVTFIGFTTDEEEAKSFRLCFEEAQPHTRDHWWLEEGVYFCEVGRL